MTSTCYCSSCWFCRKRRTSFFVVCGLKPVQIISYYRQLILIPVSCAILTLILLCCLLPSLINGVLVRKMYGIREALRRCKMEKCRRNKGNIFQQKAKDKYLQQKGANEFVHYSEDTGVLDDALCAYPDIKVNALIFRLFRFYVCCLFYNFTFVIIQF